MITVSSYQDSYFDTLIMLHETQDSPLAHTLIKEDIPAIGFYAYDSATPIAMGFLRLVEGSYAMIDTMVTNRDLDSELRHLALTTLVDRLIEHGKFLKLKGIMSHTRDKGILDRAEAIGFRESDQKIIFLSL